ncbi:YD repeat-containing protein [Lutibacter agarilyticus]|uniref:YD repeat-containing protein n=1 Tax=Lutibacter agarilyticus TaxID=1109740 RepID=A0A238XVT4_9FLAO|nr:DUF6531 domain-containing protein [Lutibacter agarilyticus]SNR63037.1 YD repeat-containing protein [Lutibacter agarilyticus]
MKKLKFFLVLILIQSTVLFAGVNLKNGNFYVSYTDLQQTTQYSAYQDLSRTYNSKATKIGLFGYGWGSKLETKLTAYPDGSVVITEYGAGGQTYYKSILMTNDLLEMMIDELIELSLEENTISNSPNAIIKERDKLVKNVDYRRKQWGKFVEKGLIEGIMDFPDGMEWESYQHGNQQLVKIAQGYVRTTGNKIETFDLAGNLVKYDKGNGVWSIVEYINNHISKIINADGSELQFTTNDDGFITEIKSSLDVAKFKYDGKDLIYSLDAAGNQYAFKYDERHNLTKIVYNPVRLKGMAEDAMHMVYEPKSSWISKITDRDGDITEYTYGVFYKEDGSKDNEHYSTKVTRIDEYGDKNTNSYEYFIGIKENSERYTKKIITTIRGIVTETTYDELCSSPIEIIRSNRKTTFKYNNRCLLIEKFSASDSIYMKYHPTLEKLNYVKNYNGEYIFEYNDNGNLTFAQKNEETWVKLIYNNEGKITEMQQEDKVLVFKYNNIGKPIKIEIKDVGAINVTYDEYGEIENVSSDDGHKTALIVTQAFQNLLALVKPAGVNLNM